MCVIAVFVALMVIMSALPIAVSAPEDDIKTIQEPYSYVRYYNGSTEIAAYKYYYTQEVDVKFDIIPATRIEYLSDGRQANSALQNITPTLTQGTGWMKSAATEHS